MSFVVSGEKGGEEVQAQMRVYYDRTCYTTTMMRCGSTPRRTTWLLLTKITPRVICSLYETLACAIHLTFISTLASWNYWRAAHWNLRIRRKRSKARRLYSKGKVVSSLPRSPATMENAAAAVAA